MTQYLLAGDGRRLTTGGGMPLTADAPGDAGTPIVAAAMPMTMTGSATISALVSVSASLAMTFGLTASPSIRGGVESMGITFGLSATPSAVANLHASAGMAFGLSASPTATAAVAAAPMPITMTLTASPSALVTVDAVAAPMPLAFGLSATPSQSAILPPITLATTFGLVARPSLDYGDLLRPPRPPRPVLLLTIGADPLPVVTPIIPVVSTPTVDGHVSTPLAPPGSLSATVTVDAVQLAWTSNGVAGSSYVIESAPDDAGTAGAYIEEAGTDNLQYTLPVTGARWVRVRARLNGRTSLPTAPVFAGISVGAEEIELIATQVEQIQVVLPEKASATALTALTTRVTSAEGTLASQAGQITTVNASLANKANASAVTALDARVTTTESGVTSYRASYTLTLDAGGRISGFKSVNDGATSSFEVLADNFKVVSGGSTGLDLDKTRMDRRFGSMAAYEGDPFGADSLVMWIGPASIAKSAATKANGTFWISASGTTGGGSMIGSSSPVYYKSESSIYQAAISATTASFARISDYSREISATLQCDGANGVVYSSNGNGSETFSAGFVIEVSRDGGAWTQVGNPSSVSVTVVRESEPGITTYATDARVSEIRAIDTGGGTNLRYRVRETGTFGTPTGWGSAMPHTVTVRVAQISLVT